MCYCYLFEYSVQKTNQKHAALQTTESCIQFFFVNFASFSSYIVILTKNSSTKFKRIRQWKWYTFLQKIIKMKIKFHNTENQAFN